jgi:hypothetical protein
VAPALVQADSSFFIVPGDEARAFGAPKADGYWTPSSDDARIASRAILQHLAAVPDTQGEKEILASFPRYRAQIAGVIRHGQRLIEANYFCFAPRDDEVPDYWKKRWVVVFDGGPCFFTFTFDPRKKAVQNLVINGLA